MTLILENHFHQNDIFPNSIYLIFILAKKVCFFVCFLNVFIYLITTIQLQPISEALNSHVLSTSHSGHSQTNL